MPSEAYSSLARVFYVLFATGLFIVGMEELAWGQQLFPIETPEFMRGINMQGEMTLHNIEGLHGDNELLIGLFALFGLVGIALGFLPRARLIYAPWPLLSWFLVLLVGSVIDYYELISWYTNDVSEFAELMLAICALLYLWLNRRRVASNGRVSATPY